MIPKLTIALALFTIASFAESPQAKPPTSVAFTNKIWKISSNPVPPQGSIYIFLANGTLLETSCVETYRIATWKADPAKPATIAVTEDGRLAFSATISGATAQTLHLRQTLALGDHEVRELDLTAVNKEFVCPDMPK